MSMCHLRVCMLSLSQGYRKTPPLQGEELRGEQGCIGLPPWRDEEAKIEDETREHFDGLAPKRHTKPQRSDYSSGYVDAADNTSAIPEYDEFQRLENDQQKLVYNAAGVPEEFVETDYYKDLNCMDKQHHSTGTGFIKMEDTSGTAYKIAPDDATNSHAGYKGNPATNDWIPASDDKVTLAPGKPNRSDN
ncbi:hypothetical protein Nepgr_013017 [Nepenthes gracilis]|uniref:Uncharacterized protein n=1 Tax=Nepenthes gracilis TaxID=150966 RepID=A0AAD3XNW7_NEPGR|nr:hypothetical protein Nepgr_013017 [Nepenthes gracilis]